MKTILDCGKIISVFFLISFIAILAPAPVSAESSVWVSPVYNFKDAKFIWVKPASFSYEYADFNLNNGKNKTANYPKAETKVDEILNNNTKKMEGRVLFVFEKKVKPQNSQPLAPQQEKPIPGIDDEKYADLILTVKVLDFGWFCQYYAPYTTMETVTTKEHYRDLDSKGKVIYEGTREVSRQVPVHHPEGYHVFDSAAAEFLLIDVKTGQTVWKYADKRDRKSVSFSESYDSTGPESVLKRIFEAAFNKMPFK